MALIHKTKKEEGKKHKTKKKTQKKQKIFRIELRKDRFRMFGPYSKPISAISVASRYNPIRPIIPQNAGYSSPAKMGIIQVSCFLQVLKMGIIQVSCFHFPCLSKFINNLFSLLQLAI